MPHIRALLQPQTIQSLPCETTVSAAAEVMSSKRIGSVVITEDNNLVGIFTERDLLTKVVATKQDPNKVTLGDVMTRDVKTVTPDASIVECSELMKKLDCRHLPVIDEDGSIYAIISIRHVLEWTINELKYERDQLAGYIQS